MLYKLTQNWLNGIYILGIILMLIMVIFGNDWNYNLKLVWTVSIILPIHACEEWQLPGGFHYQYNLAMGSMQPNQYPMNRLTDMLTVCIAELVYLIFSIFNHSSGVIMALIGFCLLEVIVHTVLGIVMYQRFKDQGKKTIYNPGLASAYLGFGTLAIAMLYHLINTAHIGLADWGVFIILIAFMFIFEIFLPEKIFKDRNTQYGFKSAMYYSKFTDQ